MASASLVVKDYRTEIPGKISDDKTRWEFPQVNSVNSHGKPIQWRIIVRVLGSTTTIPADKIPEEMFVPFEQSFLDNKPLENLKGWYKVESRVDDGPIRTVVPTIIHSGKNQGTTKSGAQKKNATNVVCQTLREAYSLHNKQLNKAVASDKKGTTERYPPMLAQVLSEQTVKPDYESKVFVQRKFNGVRAVATLDYLPSCSYKKTNDVSAEHNVTKNVTECVILYSRNKNIYPGFGYLKRELDPILSEYWNKGIKLYLDGEIYKHGVPLQEISGQSRKELTEEEETQLTKYTFMVYDCFIADNNLKYEERKAILDEIFQKQYEHVSSVETFLVRSEEEVNKLYNDFIKEGYEGAMVRLNSKYVYSYNSHHSKVLLKIKPRYDAEFEIVNWTVGEKGKASGALMIKCKTTDGKEFPVTPAMEITDRKKLAEKMATIEDNSLTYFENHYFGKPLIVYFDEWSKDKIPLRASTEMEIRTWE